MKNKIKNALSFFALCFIIISTVGILLLPISAQKNEIEIDFEDNAKAIYFYSFNANRVLYEKGTDIRLAPASTAKIMTGLIACQEFENSLDDEIEITSNMLKNISGVTMGLKAGEKIKIRDLLYGTVCGGNNDAAQALAVLSSGGISAFVTKMNKQASLLNMHHTKYANPTGLDDEDAKTTISDVALLSKEAIKNELYLKISSAKSYSYTTVSNEEKTIPNRNALISQFSALGYQNEMAKGLIAGNTDEGGYVCSAYAEDGEMKYLCIVMGAVSDENRIYSYYIINKLLSYTSYNYTYKKIASKGDILGSAYTELALLKNDETNVDCVLKDDIYAFLPKNVSAENIEIKPFYYKDVFTAPLSKDSKLGYVNIFYNGSLVAQEELILAYDVKENTVVAFLEGMKDFFMSRFFILFVIVLLPALAIYFIIDAKKNRHRRVRHITFNKLK